MLVLLSTGEFLATLVSGVAALREEVARIAPREILIPRDHARLETALPQVPGLSGPVQAVTSEDGTVRTISAVIQSFFGSSVAGQFSQFSRVWWVIMQGDAQYRAKPEDFDKIFVRSKSGANIPLSALITTRYVASPKLVTRFNGFPAVKITGSEAPGYSSGQAIAAMEQVAAETLPADFSYAWAGQALQEKESGSTSSSAFVFGLIVVFLILAAQFEKWTLPIAVVLSVPFAVLGALALTWVLGLQNDVYFQVGLVTLVGLSAKNAILICEFAIERVHKGMAPKEAASVLIRAAPVGVTSSARTPS